MMNIYMVLFDIIKHCENERNKCRADYSRTISAGNDPSITRRQRFAQRVRNYRYRSKVNRVEAQGGGIPHYGQNYNPIGNIFAFPRRF
jgi:hypothetical protein